MRINIPEGVEQSFLDGVHALSCRHREGVWNSVFATQFGEQTYIKNGNSKGGLAGLTLSAQQVARWILSNNVCNTVSNVMDKMFDEGDDEYDATHDIH